MAAFEDRIIGRVLRSSTVGYACGTRSSDVDMPSFGAFVRTEHLTNGSGETLEVIGLIYAIRIDDDPLVRQLIMANNMNTATIRDQRENRMVPVEMSIVNIGYRLNATNFHNLPPRPPMSLDPVYLCADDLITEFTNNPDFFRLILSQTDVPTEELVAAALRNAAAARPAREQHDFLVQAGRRLAQLLSHDLARLNHLLRLIKP